MVLGCVFELLVDAEAAGGDVVVEVVEIFDDAVSPGRFGLPSHCSIEHGRACASELGYGRVFEEVDRIHENKFNEIKPCFKHY